MQRRTLRQRSVRPACRDIQPMLSRCHSPDARAQSHRLGAVELRRKRPLSGPYLILACWRCLRMSAWRNEQEGGYGKEAAVTPGTGQGELRTVDRFECGVGTNEYTARISTWLSSEPDGAFDYCYVGRDERLAHEGRRSGWERPPGGAR